jgi:anti-sigma factor RsiW
VIEVNSPLHKARFWRDHRWTPGHMSAYLDDELKPGAVARLRRHIAECPECRRILHELQRMLGLLRTLPATATGETPDIASAVRRRLRERTDE